MHCSASKSFRQYREDIKILFREWIPENILMSLRQGKSISRDMLGAKYEKDTEELYEKMGVNAFPLTTPDERVMRYRAMWERYHDRVGSYYSLLWQYGNSVLRIRGNDPVVRIEKVLGWNSLSLQIGQDLVTCAWLAYRDYNAGSPIGKKRNFTWPAVLKTDDIRLQGILDKGLAENHFHLNGSTQSFSISWICLMNHPVIARKLDEDSLFSYRLRARHSYHRDDRMMEWGELVVIASYIRALLFEHCGLGNLSKENVKCQFSHFHVRGGLAGVAREVTGLRHSVGRRIQMSNNAYRVLDYALTNDRMILDENSPFRALSGERLFLYCCLRGIYSNSLSYYEMDLLHIYLLIKNLFRSEMIMSNGQIGFEVFSQYQDRKDFLFGELREYWEEAHRLSVGASVMSGHVISVEARITPRITAQDMLEGIRVTDHSIDYGLGIRHGNECRSDDMCLPAVQKPYFYVIHFPKTKEKFVSDKNKDKITLKPRFGSLRQKSETQARAMQRLRLEHRKDGERIRGIDACSSEIYCRPEVFASEFRYLADDSGMQEDRFEGKKRGGLHRTYHAGEDFLDIIDGLRAVDEAYMFLELDRGDRIGHGTVLGIEADLYYQRKRYVVVMEKQRLLDNLVWMLHRALEWGIEMESSFKDGVRSKITELLQDIYEDPGNIWCYYNSWKLRGDEPKWYEPEGFCYENEKEMECHTHMADFYEYYRIGRRKEVREARRIKKSCQLYYRYHFDMDVRYRGNFTINFEVGKEYIRVVTELQKCMRSKLAKSGIVIECNPTSNFLIGPIEQYSEHPIWTMSAGNLFSDNHDICMDVTINTDDIGVFATSLENEYAVMLRSGYLKRKEEYGRDDDQALYEYLENVRQNGLRAVFE